MIEIFAALDQYGTSAGVVNAQRLRAFVMVLRYSGMRIGDTVGLSASSIIGNKLFLYTQKTGVPVNCILPDFVLRELEQTPRSTKGHFFWTGKSKLHSAVGKWQRRLKRLFALAGIDGGHAHRFRDTFSVNLLSAGVPLERVSVLLGHSSIRITERHYSPWVHSRQEQLEADLNAALKQDPVAIMGAQGALQGTKKVQKLRGQIN
jgi:integrase/recombinase XerD